MLHIDKNNLCLSLVKSPEKCNKVLKWPVCLTIGQKPPNLQNMELRKAIKF